MQTATKTYRFVGRILPDGHLSIPEDLKTEAGSEFEVTMTPVDNTRKLISLYLEGRLERTGSFNEITKGLDLDADRIAEAAMKEYGTDDIDANMSMIRR